MGIDVAETLASYLSAGMLLRKVWPLLIGFTVIATSCSGSTAVVGAEQGGAAGDTVVAASQPMVAEAPTAQSVQPTNVAEAPTCAEFESDALTTLLPEGALRSEVWGVNERGDVVGEFYREGDGADLQGAVWWSDGSLEELNLGKITRVRDINNSGVIVGRDNIGMGTSSFLRAPGGELEWFDVPDSTATIVDDINNRGQAAGSYFFDGHRSVAGFLRDADGTLTTFSPPGEMNPAVQLNDRGEIAGVYQLDGESVAYVRSPSGDFTTFPTTSGDAPDYITLRGFSENGAFLGTNGWNSGLSAGFVRSADGILVDLGPFSEVTMERPAFVTASGAIVGIDDGDVLVIAPDRSVSRFTADEGDLQVLAISESMHLVGVYRDVQVRGFHWTPGACIAGS